MLRKKPCKKQSKHGTGGQRMSDLIYRRDAVSRMSDLLMIELGGKRLPTWNEVNDAINDLPSAQPEIVRCKECKWSYDDVSGRICSHGVCVDCVVSDDFYCADAERRTDG